MPNWRTAFKSDFMASWDLDSNVILTISRVEQKDVQLTKKELKNVAYFSDKTFPNGEVVKPMILNATNCKVLNMFTGTKEVSDWKNIQVEIGVTQNKGRIGEATGLSILRIISGGVNQLDKLKTLYDEVKQSGVVLTDEEQAAMDKIISDKDADNYGRAIKFLESKKPTNGK